MSEDFVDVTWRGLEVVRKARLRGKDARTAYVEHGTPMPTGSRLTLHTADGLELQAVVARVQEQIGGRAEPPGMELTVEATGAAATWWLERVEAHARSTRAAARQTLIMTRSPDEIPDLAVAPIMAVIDTGPMPAVAAMRSAPAVSAGAEAAGASDAGADAIDAIEPEPDTTAPDLVAVAAAGPALDAAEEEPTETTAPPIAPAMSVRASAAVTLQGLPTVPMPAALASPAPAAPPATPAAPTVSVRSTQPMPTVAPARATPARDRTQHAAPDEPTEILRGAPVPTAGESTDPRDARDGVPAGIDDGGDVPADHLIDDGRRTTIMAAVDIAAIVSASSDVTPADDDAAGGDKKKVARGKRRRGR